MFKTRYRIVRDWWRGYEVQVKHGWFGFWHMPKINTLSSIEEAKAYIEDLKFVLYVD